jgi:putative addiction module component (TIGR02574 family)
MNTYLLEQAKLLDVDEQIELVEAIWNGIVNRDAAPSITDAQKDELDYRLTDYLANPNDVLSWDEVKASAYAKISE